MPTHTLSQITPWHAGVVLHRAIASQESVEDWSISKLSELATVIITAALLASIICSSLSWPTLAHSPWTTKALFYSGLIVSLTSISSACQQSVALYRSRALSKDIRAHMEFHQVNWLHLYVWQMPVILLNIGIVLFLLGLIIMIWEAVARDLKWNQEAKIAVVTTIACIFCLASYLAGSITLYTAAARAISTDQVGHAHDNRDSGQQGSDVEVQEIRVTGETNLDSQTIEPLDSRSKVQELG